MRMRPVGRETVIDVGLTKRPDCVDTIRYQTSLYECLGDRVSRLWRSALVYGGTNLGVNK